MNQKTTRERWILRAVDLVRPVLADAAGLDVPAVRVSCGDLGRKHSGVCYPATWTADGVREIALSLRHQPLPVDVLGTVAHELIHAAGVSNHQRDFQRPARLLGLVTPSGRFTDSGLDGVSLADAPEWARRALRRLGPWPAPALRPVDKPKRQAVRMVKVTCRACDVVWRASRVHLLRGVGCPVDGCAGPAVVHWPAAGGE